MDSREGRQVVQLLKKFLLPKLRAWLKQKFASNGSGSGNSGPSGGYNAGGQQQPYQQTTYSNPPQPQQHYQQSYASHAQGYQQQSAVDAYSQGGYPSSQSYPQQQSPQHGAYSQGQFQPTQPQQYKPPHGNDDMQNAQDPHYVALRNQAIQAGNQMHKCFDGASQAHQAGDGARAKQLSTEGHQHQQQRDQLNKQAADWIFQANNRVQPQGTIDLHGLYVQEAIDRTETAVRDAQSKGLPQLRVITGKGIHSNNHVAKIKPAIEQLMVKYNLTAHLDDHNTGVLIVNLTGSGSRSLDWVDQADREAGDGQCVVM